MTATVAEHPALADLKDCVTRLLLDLAALTTLITTHDCAACPDSLTSVCAYHLAQAAMRHRLERAASMAAQAETEAELEAAIVYAGVERLPGPAPQARPSMLFGQPPRAAAPVRLRSRTAQELI